MSSDSRSTATIWVSFSKQTIRFSDNTIKWGGFVSDMRPQEAVDWIRNSGTSG